MFKMHLKFLIFSLLFIANKSISNEYNYSEEKSIEIIDIKNPDAFRTKKIIQNIKLFGEINENDRKNIRLSFHLFMNDNSKIPAQLRLNLESDNHTEKLNLTENGELAISEEKILASKESEIVANIKKGNIRITYFIQPIIKNPMTVGYLKESMRQAKIAYEKLYGPLLSWSVPTFTCSVFNFSNPTKIKIISSSHEIIWASETGTRLKIPLTNNLINNDHIIDWGGNLPHRIGGCLIESTRSVE